MEPENENERRKMRTPDLIIQGLVSHVKRTCLYLKRTGSQTSL